MHISTNPAGVVPINSSGRKTIIKVVGGDTWSVTANLYNPANPREHATPNNTKVSVVLSETQFDDPLWTGEWYSGVSPDPVIPGLCSIAVPRAVTMLLRRGSYSFSIRVSDLLKTSYKTECEGTFLVEYKPTSDQHSIPYKDGTSNYGSTNVIGFMEFLRRADFPKKGELGKIYLADDTNKLYRWNGEKYIELGGIGTDLVAVHYTKDYHKNESERKQARDNIGALSAEDPLPQVEGKLPVRNLPKYLHEMFFDDVYNEDAEKWYEEHSKGPFGGCSAVRKGNKLGRNYDGPFSEASEFVIHISAGVNDDGTKRLSSVGVATLGSELTEDKVCSGEHNELYRVLPGRAVDGINSAGVAVEVNVIPRGGLEERRDLEPGETRTLHCFGVVRYVLDRFSSAEEAASTVKDIYYIPQESEYSYHWMIADKDGTWIVEDGQAFQVEQNAMTNCRVAHIADYLIDGSVDRSLLAEYDPYGNGAERLDCLIAAESVEEALEAAAFTKAYSSDTLPVRLSEYADEVKGIAVDDDVRLGKIASQAIEIWESKPREEHRGTGVWWQTIHSSVYDLENRTLAVSVQEDFEKRYMFSVNTHEHKVNEIEGLDIALEEKRSAPDYRALRRICDIWTWERVAADPSEGLVETPADFIEVANMTNAAYPEFNEVSGDWWYAGIYWPNGRFRYEATSGLAGSATTANLVYAFVSYDEEGHEIARFKAKATRDPLKVNDRRIEPPDAYGGNAFSRIATTDIVHYMDSVVLAKAEEEIAGKYTKPDAGIPKSDLASDVQTSLGKADTALQEHQDISGKADKSDTYTKGETDAAITANVEDVLTSESTTHALSANMGRSLKEQIDNLEQRGRYLSVWDSTRGLAKTEPPVNPYEYKSGDYFIVGTVGVENYRPNGAWYDKDSPSTVRETDEVLVNDTYYYDGTNWSLSHTEQSSLSWGSIVGDIGDQEDLSEALGGKLDKDDVVPPDSNAEEGQAADALATKTELGKKADASTTYTKSEVDTAVGLKANKAANPTAGHIAALDASGNPVDSGKTAADFTFNVNGVSPTDGNVDVKRVYNDQKDEMIDGSGNVYTSTVIRGGYILLHNSSAGTDRRLDYTGPGSWAGSYIWGSGSDAIVYFSSTGLITYGVGGTGWGNIAPRNIDPTVTGASIGSGSKDYLSYVHHPQTAEFPPEDQPTAHLARGVKNGATATPIQAGADGFVDVSALFTSANTSLMGVVRYAFNSDGTIKDRAINAITYAGGALPNFPAQVSGYARDFLLNVTVTATASDISLPESGATSVGDALAFEANHTYLVAITEIAAKKYYIRIIDTTPAN